MAKPKTLESAFHTYQVAERLGGGGSGEVFAVTSDRGEEFAAKVLSRTGVSSERLARFQNEISFCHRVVHPNVVRVLDWGFVPHSDGKAPFYVMPRYPATLRDRLGALSGDDALAVFASILDGVEAAHLLGAWHRDLKPENVLIGDTTVVADFGIAHFLETERIADVETRPHSRLANFQYSAPEQRKKGAAVDRRADIYSLGLMLSELFTGDVPQGAGYRRIADVAPSYAYLDGLVDRMIAQSPGQRPSSISEVKGELIGRGNSFIAEQELSAAQDAVVERFSPDSVEMPRIVSVDYRNGSLFLGLSYAPDEDWINVFTAGQYSHSSVTGVPPEAFRFQGEMARVSVHMDDAQRVIDHFKEWVPIVSAMVEGQRRRNAEAAERRAKAAHRAKVAEAEGRKRLLDDLKF